MAKVLIFSLKNSFTPEQEKAVGKLKRMKVYKVMTKDTYKENEYQSYFDYLFYMALREYDLWEEGEETTELNEQQAFTAKKWLKENQHLTTEFKNSNI